MGTLTERWEALKAQKTAADRALAGAEADEATATANLNTAVAAVTEAGFDSIGALDAEVNRLETELDEVLTQAEGAFA